MTMENLGRNRRVMKVRKSFQEHVGQKNALSGLLVNGHR